MDPEVILDELERGASPGNQVAQGGQLSFEQLFEPTDDDVSASHVELLPKPRKRKSADPPVTGRHQDIRLYIAVLLKTYAEMTDAGIVRESPYQVLLAPGKIVQPDIVFISNQNFDRVHETFVEGPPDIAIEVTVPSTTAMDRGEKFVLYESLGVKEYWVIDLVREMVNFYYLGQDGYYDEFRADINGRFRSRTLKGFTLEVDRLWRRILPMTSEIVGMVQSMVTTR